MVAPTIFSLYSVSFLTSTVALILWFFFQKNNKISGLMSAVFLGAILAYIYSIFKADADMTYKAITISRDLLIMAGAAAFLSLFTKYKGMFFLFLGTLLVAYHFFYDDILTNTFPQQRTEEVSQLKKAADVVSDKNIELSAEGELLVELKSTSDIVFLKSELDKYDCTIRKAFGAVKDNPTTQLDEYFIIDIPTNQLHQLSTIKDIINDSSYVNWLEDNEVIRLSPMEAVPARKSKKAYGIDDPEIDKLWGFDFMEIDKLYTLLKKRKAQPKKKALIAVLDTGIDAKHEDLKANYKSIKSKYDKDSNKHGTHVAGIAAAVSNNKKGIASFSTNNSYVEVASVQVLAGFGGGTQAGIINGMIEAADAGAEVISMSLGGRSNSSRQKAYSEAVKYCNKKGAIVVVAAGNSNMDAKDYSPANATGVITVAAIDEQMNRAHFSNHIKNVGMGISAPGTNIYSTIPNNQYGAFNGTSMATPYVSGLIGLMKSIQPDLTTEEIHTILSKTGKKTNNPKETGAFIYPAKAIEMLLDK